MPESKPENMVKDLKREMLGSKGFPSAETLDEWHDRLYLLECGKEDEVDLHSIKRRFEFLEDTNLELRTVAIKCRAYVNDLLESI